MPKSIVLIIVEKTGILRNLTIKDYKEEDLYKKCNFKKAEGFIVQNEWSTKLNGQKYYFNRMTRQSTRTRPSEEEMLWYCYNNRIIKEKTELDWMSLKTSLITKKTNLKKYKS